MMIFLNVFYCVLLPLSTVLFLCLILVVWLAPSYNFTTLPTKLTTQVSGKTTPCPKDLKGKAMTMPGYTPTTTVHSTTSYTSTRSPAQILLEAVLQDTKDLAGISGEGGTTEASETTKPPKAPAKVARLVLEPIAMVGSQMKSEEKPKSNKKTKSKDPEIKDLIETLHLIPTTKQPTTQKAASTEQDHKKVAKSNIKQPVAQGALSSPNNESAGDPNHRAAVLGGSIGGAIGGVVLIAGIALAIVLVKKKRGNNHKETVDFTGSEEYGGVDDVE